MRGALPGRVTHMHHSAVRPNRSLRRRPQISWRIPHTWSVVPLECAALVTLLIGVFVVHKQGVWRLVSPIPAVALRIPRQELWITHGATTGLLYAGRHDEKRKNGT